MIAPDDVLLLRPVPPGAGFPPPDSPRPPVGRGDPPPSILVATICPYEERLVEAFDREVRPALGTSLLACFRTEHSPNTFPALPVREGEDVFVWFARHPTLDAVDRTYAGPGRRRGRGRPGLEGGRAQGGGGGGAALGGASREGAGDRGADGFGVPGTAASPGAPRFSRREGFAPPPAPLGTSPYRS